MGALLGMTRTCKEEPEDKRRWECGVVVGLLVPEGLRAYDRAAELME